MAFTSFTRKNDGVQGAAHAEVDAALRQQKTGWIEVTCFRQMCCFAKRLVVNIPFGKLT